MTWDSWDSFLKNEKRNGDLIVGMRVGRKKEVVYMILTFSQNLKKCKNKNETEGRGMEWGGERRARNKRIKKQKNSTKFKHFSFA